MIAFDTGRHKRPDRQTYRFRTKSGRFDPDGRRSGAGRSTPRPYRTDGGDPDDEPATPDSDGTEDAGASDDPDAEDADPLAQVDLPSLLVDEFPECPRCGDPVLRITMTGPTDRFAAPCGCRLGAGLELT